MCLQYLLQNHRVRYSTTLLLKSLASFAFLKMLNDSFFQTLHLLLSKKSIALHENFWFFLVLVVLMLALRFLLSTCQFFFVDE